MILGPSRDDSRAPGDESIGKRVGIRSGTTLIALEVFLERLAERNGLRRDDMHERSTLDAGHHRRVDELGPHPRSPGLGCRQPERVLLILADEDEAAARTAESL